ncbi:MAG: hypothetical protein AB7E80_03220 [Hyphomicrobiaceae bacterium]
MGRHVTSSFSAAVCVLIAAVGLSGCGAGDVELNGKIFDAMGVSSATSKKSGDARLSQRNGLVVPPSTGSLPEPGSGAPPPEAEADLAFINDPDRRATMDRTQLAREQAEFCKKNYEEPKARGDNSVDGVVGPGGPCRATFLSAMKKWNGSSDDE